MENERNPHSLDDERLLGTADLAKLLGRSQKAIRIAASKRPKEKRSPTLPRPRHETPPLALEGREGVDGQSRCTRTSPLEPSRMAAAEVPDAALLSPRNRGRTSGYCGHWCYPQCSCCRPALQAIGDGMVATWRGQQISLREDIATLHW